MIRLLIVEDENRTRELLRNYIPWEELGIGEARTARNGLAALELTSTWTPDIILCDVRMPKLNGIEFSKRYREKNPRCKIIFLSGFSDKEYLKSAIFLKALTYLEKPIILEEVQAAVEAAVKLCAEEQRKHTEELQLQAEVDRSLPFLRQEMVRKLITSPDSPHVRPALGSSETFLLPLQGPYTVLAAELYWNPADLPEDPLPVQDSLLDAINREPQMLAWRAIAGFDSGNRLVLIVPGEYRSSYREGRDTAENLGDVLLRLAGPAIELKIGVGEPAASLLDIPAAYKLAADACMLQYYYNQTKLVFADALGRHEPLDTNREEVRLMRGQVQKGEIEAAKVTLRRWTQYAGSRMDLDILRLKDSYFQFLLTILECAAQLGVAEPAEDAERRYMWKELDRVSSLTGLERYVLTFLELLQEQPDGEQAAGAGKMREIIRFIHSHLHEKGFTIRSIADHVQLSETYLCAFFKKQRGQTVKEFITETKMNKARERLREPNVKLLEIALDLGFTDANYFTTFFKRCEGCTPSEYRERAMK
ncbi:response regulator [Paenibacillus sp. FSL R7-0331]|uniref:response regulator n=1 Tax=Paenibacillus sp. FSL R7-0331 TaxID=1536773 RepID=UPI000A518D66|nr:response regulator [Paenibacillus sp. FSL R7-0331]